MGAQDKGALLDSEMIMNNDMQGAMGKAVQPFNPLQDMYGRNSGFGGVFFSNPGSDQPMGNPSNIPQMSVMPNAPQMSPVNNQYQWYQQGLDDFIRRDNMASQQQNISQPNGLMGNAPQQIQQPARNGLMGH